MDLESDTTDKAAEYTLAQRAVKIEVKIKNGANWLFWIAGLSLLNSLIHIFGGTLTFVIGLGIAQLVDGLVSAVIAEFGDQIGLISRIIGLGINIVIAAVFVAFGYFARNKKSWAFIIGMVIYALDTIIFLMVGDYFGLVFHFIALVGLFTGFKALKELKTFEEKNFNESGQYRQIAELIQEKSQEEVEAAKKRFKVFVMIVFAIPVFLFIILGILLLINM
jgi:hypothetical protein